MLATRPPIDLPPMTSGPSAGPSASMAATYSGITALGARRRLALAACGRAAM